MQFLLLFLGTLFASTVPAAPDTLVVCPAEFRDALAPWEDYRRSQGHTLLVVEPPETASGVQALVRGAAQAGRLRYLVLVGDVPDEQTVARGVAVPTVPTNYIRAEVNVRWGSKAMIATDTPYADTDGDGAPNLAVGRIPANSADEVAAVVRKILHYEQHDQGGPWEQRLQLVAGVGGFGIIADAVIEAVGRQVLRETVPQGYEVWQTLANPRSPHHPPPGQFRARVHEQFNEGALAWIYLGHGLSNELDRVRTPTGEKPIMSVDDVPLLQCGPQSPVAVMIACYTGAIDASTDCLAERLALEENGPVAVIAATRVTMPYGNTVFGYELMRACFQDRPLTLGDVMRLAQRRTLDPTDPENTLRSSFDTLAVALSPPPVDLVNERREHVAMYLLLGDPLLRLRGRTAQVSRQTPAVSGSAVVK